VPTGYDVYRVDGGEGGGGEYVNQVGMLLIGFLFRYTAQLFPNHTISGQGILLSFYSAYVCTFAAHYRASFLLTKALPHTPTPPALTR